MHQESILKQVSEGGNVDVVHLDYAKAFDEVDHNILLCKLRDLGLAEIVAGWLNSFLTGRKQVVSVSSHLSEPSEVKTGVPQGSVLGPILCITMVTDTDKGLHCSLFC